jgi:hypothetical protein
LVLIPICVTCVAFHILLHRFDRVARAGSWTLNERWRNSRKVTTNALWAWQNGVSQSHG